MKIIEKIGFFIFLVLLLTGTIMTLFRIEIDIDLYGVYNEDKVVYPTKEEKFENLLNGSYMQFIEKDYEASYALRNVLIKLNNTVGFVMGKSANNNVTIVGDYNLFESPYLNDYAVGNDEYNGELNRVKIQEIVEELDYVKQNLSIYEIACYVYITPNKAEFYEEDVKQSNFWANGQRVNNGAIRNVDVLREELDKYNIAYMDSAEYIKSELPENVVPFVKSGIHYTWAAGHFSFYELLRRIEIAYDINMPKYDLDVKDVEEIVFPNADLYDLQNTYKTITDFIYANNKQQVISIDNIQKSDVKMFIQGGSFLGPVIELTMNYPEMFGWLDVVQNNQYVGHDGFKTYNEIGEIDIDSVLKCDVLVFEVNQDCAAGMSFGFIHELAKYFEDNALNDNCR